MEKALGDKNKLNNKSQIENCDFEFNCPKQWSELSATADKKIKFCDYCREKVYLCESLEKADEHAAQRHCVAINKDTLDRIEEEDSTSEMLLGIRIPRSKPVTSKLKRKSLKDLETDK